MNECVQIKIIYSPKRGSIIIHILMKFIFIGGLKFIQTKKIIFHILMVFCDREYEFKDYIESYKEFINIIKKK